MQRSITGYQNIESSSLGNGQELAVLQTSPSHVGGSERFVLKKMLTQAVRKIFVEQRLHGVN
jgi:hypothetical protein